MSHNPAIMAIADKYSDDVGILGDALNDYFQSVSVGRCMDCREIFTVEPVVPLHRFSEWLKCAHEACRHDYDLHCGDAL